MATATRNSEVSEARERLLTRLKPGDTVYTVLRHVSESGMSRSISPIIIQDGEPEDIGYLVSTVLGYKYNTKHGGLKMGGCGMDMGYSLVYNLSRELFQDNFTCIGERCPSNVHVNGDRDYTPHAHSDGGYALRQRWI